MARARKMGSAGRRLARLGRPLLAAGLLAALGWAAAAGVSRSKSDTDDGRKADRLQVTRAASSSAGGWLQTGLDEATEVANRAKTDGAAVVESYDRAPHVFSEAFIADLALRRVAGNQRYGGSDNALLVCRTPDGNDEGLRGLVQSVAAGNGPAVRVFDDPKCAPIVAAAFSFSRTATKIRRVRPFWSPNANHRTSSSTPSAT